jgi:hypothetical protein
MANRYWVGGNGTWNTSSTTNWSTASGGASGASVPTASDAVIVDSASGSPTITLTGALTCLSLTTTGATCTLTSTGTLSISGGMTLSATTTWSATGLLTFLLTGTITTNGVSIASPITLNGASQTFTLGSALTSTGTLTLTAGTFDASTYNVTVPTFSSSNSNTRSVLLGTGTWTILTTTASITVWDFSTATNLTVTPSTSTILLNTTGASLTFAGGGKTFNNFALVGSTSSITFTGANTFNTFQNRTINGVTAIFPASTTTTFTNFMAGGGDGNNFTINSSSAGTATTFSQATGAVSVSNVTVQDSTVTGGATWTNYNGVNGTNNTGWTFNGSIPASLYWVGGNGTWSGGGNSSFSLTSGGAATGVSPTSIRQNITAFVDGNSGNPTITITGGATASTGSLNTTGATCTFAGTSNFTVGNNAGGTYVLTLSSTTTWSNSGTLTLNSPGSGNLTITAPSTTFNCPVATSNTNSRIILASNMTIASTRTWTISAFVSNITLATFTLSVGFLSTGSLRLNLTNTSGSITLTGNSGTVFSCGSTSTFLTAATPINCTYSGSTGTRTISQLALNTNGAFLPVFNISAGSDTVAIATSSYLGGLDFTGFTGTWAPGTASATFYGSITLVSGMTFTTPTGGAWTFANTSGTATLISAGKTLYAITESGAGGTLAFSGATTLSNALTFTAGTLQLPASTTTTVNSFVTTGTTFKYLTSSIPGTQATIAKASGATAATYMQIQDSNATGGTWSATNSTDAGNNTGWTFLSPIIYPVSSTENSGLADVVSNNVVSSRAIIEALTSADSKSVIKGFNSSITEILTSDDSEDSIKAFNLEIVEALTSADSETTQTNFNSAIVEALTSADSETGIKAFYSAIIEALTSADFIASQTNFNSQIIENLVLLDSLIGSGWFTINDNQTVTWNAVNNTQSITWQNIGDDQTPNWQRINNTQE